MDLQHIINCLTALHLNTDKKNEASFDIENILIMLLQYKKEQALQLQQTSVSSSANYHAKEIVKKLTSRPHLEDVDGFYDIVNDELQMIDIVKKYLSKHYH